MRRSHNPLSNKSKTPWARIMGVFLFKCIGSGGHSGLSRILVLNGRHPWWNSKERSASPAAQPGGWCRPFGCRRTPASRRSCIRETPLSSPASPLVCSPFRTNSSSTFTGRDKISAGNRPFAAPAHPHRPRTICFVLPDRTPPYVPRTGTGPPLITSRFPKNKKHPAQIRF